MLDKSVEFKPYSSIKMDIPTFAEINEILEKILISNVELLPRQIDKQVIIYGAGSLGKMAKYFFEYLKIPFLYFIDKNSVLLKSDAFWSNLDIIPPDKVSEEDKKKSLLIICIVTTQLIALRDKLKADGWKDIAFFYDVSEAYTNRYPLSNGWFLNKPDENEIDAMKKVLSFLDNESRLNYLQFLAWRRLRVELLFKTIQINLNNRFFIPEIINSLYYDEVFVDCGAHIGTVSKKFVELTKGKYKKIFTIEADDETYTKLENNLRDIPNCKCIKYALSDKNSKENFYQGFDYASKLNKSGNVTVKTTQLDSLKIPATFIKIHLEGGELLSLKGAKHTIQKYRPIIVVTLYHNPDGAWKIPLCIIEWTQNYIYFMKLHSWGGTGAVFYAIPKERYEKKELL